MQEKKVICENKLHKTKKEGGEGREAWEHG